MTHRRAIERWVYLGLGVTLLVAAVGLSYITFQPYLGSLAAAIPTAPAEVTPLATPTPRPSPTLSDAQLLAASVAAYHEETVATATPWPTATPVWTGTEPVQLRIPAIHVDAPVEPISLTQTWVDGQAQRMWAVPDHAAAGWHETSARLGVPGNTVLNGHNTTHGEVFRDLYKLQEGDVIFVRGANGKTYTYQVAEIYILPEAGQPLSVRLKNAQYIQPTTDERLTLVTCHPYASLANRLIVIARPRPPVAPTGEQ